MQVTAALARAQVAYPTIARIGATWRHWYPWTARAAGVGNQAAVLGLIADHRGQDRDGDIVGRAVSPRDLGKVEQGVHTWTDFGHAGDRVGVHRGGAADHHAR